MKKIIIFCIFFSLLLMISLQTQAREVDLSAGEEFDDSTQNIYTDDIRQGAIDLYNFGKELSDFNGTRPSPQPTDQETTQDPTISSNPGSSAPTPTKFRTDESQYADKIIEIIHKNCTSGKIAGIVTRRNRDCLDSLKNGIMNDPEIAELKQSPIDNDFLQCVPCARVMSNATGGKYNGYGDAKTHIGKKVAGYEYISMQAKNNLSKIVPGSIFIVNTGTYGHIGYVTEVIKDDNGQPVVFRAFECNLQKNGYVSHERKRISIYAVTGFQVPI